MQAETSQHFWFGGLKPQSISHSRSSSLSPSPTPSLSFSFSFRLLPFSSHTLFPGVPSSYPKSSYVWGALWYRFSDILSLKDCV